MTRQWVFERKTGGMSKSLNLHQLMAAANTRILVGHGPFEIKKDGRKVGGGTRAETLNRLVVVLNKGKIGPQYRVWDTFAGRSIVFHCREVQPVYQPTDTSGNDKVDAFAGEIYGRFASFHPRYAGAYVCKPSSQHRFGNAIDFFFDNLDEQDQVATWASGNAERLNIEHVISRNRIWTKGVGWHAYTGEYHSHLHTDFDPNFPTSWPCGVRG